LAAAAAYFGNIVALAAGAKANWRARALAAEAELAEWRGRALAAEAELAALKGVAATEG